MTHEELKNSVPVQSIRGRAAFIRLADVPNPFRSECWNDHLGANIPEKWGIWVWDWQRWLAKRFSGNYLPRHAVDAKLITDEMISVDQSASVSHIDEDASQSAGAIEVDRRRS